MLTNAEIMRFVFGHLMLDRVLECGRPSVFVGGLPRYNGRSAFARH